MDHCTNLTKGSRAKILIAICVLSGVLGVFYLVQNLQGIADRLYPNNETLTDQQIDTILKPYLPARWCLLVLDLINGAILIVGSILAYRLQPIGRKFLIAALLFTILLDGLGLVWTIGAGVATFQVTLHHINESMQASSGRTGSLDVMKTALIIGYIFGIAIVLVKVGLEAAACKYLQSAAICDLYRFKDNRVLNQK